MRNVAPGRGTLTRKAEPVSPAWQSVQWQSVVFSGSLRLPDIAEVSGAVDFHGFIPFASHMGAKMPEMNPVAIHGDK